MARPDRAMRAPACCERIPGPGYPPPTTARVARSLRRSPARSRVKSRSRRPCGRRSSSPGTPCAPGSDRGAVSTCPIDSLPARIAIHAEEAVRMKLRGLYAITPEKLPREALLEKLGAALEGGIALLQYRRKPGSLDEAREVVAL